VWLLGEFAAVIAGASQQLASELGRSRWGCNGQEWIKVCDAGVITTPVSGALTTKEGGRQLVVEQVVEKVALAGLTNYLILTKTNYNQWAMLMRIKLEARGLWGAVDPGGADFQVDRMALDAICNVVPPEMINALVTKDTTLEAWESIKAMRIGGDHIRKASAQRVRHEYELLAFCGGKGVEDFSMSLVGIVHQLATLGI
jgi:hypothetical protein